MEEKNRAIEKKTQAATQAIADKNRINTELSEIRDHMDIKDRKINVLQRKVRKEIISKVVFPIKKMVLHKSVLSRGRTVENYKQIKYSYKYQILR